MDKNDRWKAVKVKSPGEKIWYFLTPNGGETRLRIHASLFEDRAKAERVRDEIIDLNPGVLAKVVVL